MRQFSVRAGESRSALLFDNPIWRRERRTRWRDGRAMLLVLGFVTVLSFLLIRRYAAVAVLFSPFDGPQPAARDFATSFWAMIAWVGTLVALVVAPALTSASIAYERERGLLEGLQLSPLRPAQIVFGKWLSSLAFIVLLWGVALPIILLLLLVGVPPRQFVAVLAWHALTLAFASGLGIACSAWAHRAHFALRTTYGFLLLLVFSSFGAAYLAGETFLPPPTGWKATLPMVWWGRVNPILAVQGIASPSPFATKWPVAAVFMALMTPLCLWVAILAVKRPLVQNPFIESKPRPKKPKPQPQTATAKPAPAMSHMAVPIVGQIYFQNPVLGREVRSKFRMRQPPLVVLLVEALLALVVAGFYIYTVGRAIFDPESRGVIFYGVAITAMIVTLMSCAVMGANGFSREREAGTWEGVQLSLLSPRQIVWGKLCGTLITCALFSLPVLPLMLVCIRWTESWRIPLNPPKDAIVPGQLLSALLVWSGSILWATLIGMWIGRRTPRSAVASGRTLGTGLAIIVGIPTVLVLTSNAKNWDWIVGCTNPLIVLVMSAGPAPDIWLWATGVPFFVFCLVTSLLLWIAVIRDVEREFARKLVIESPSR